MYLREIRYIDWNELHHMLDNTILELLVDTKTGRIFHVNPKIGHLKTAAIYLRTEHEHINSLNAGHLVSAVIEIRHQAAHRFLVGKASLELSHHVEHTPKQIAAAEVLIKNLIRLSKQVGSIKKAA